MNSSTKWLDWSHPIIPGMQTFDASWHREVSFEALGAIGSVNRRTSQIHIGSHSGTHLDAPAHFIQEGATIDQLELERFEGVLKVVDMSFVGPNERVDARILDGLIPHFSAETAAVGFFFDWAKRFGTRDFYTHQPYFSEDAARLISALSPKLIAYDLAMPDNPLEGFRSREDSRIHKIFLSGGIPLAESVRIDDPRTGNFRYCAIPLGLSGLDGSPVRFIVRHDDV